MSREPRARLVAQWRVRLLAAGAHVYVTDVATDWDDDARTAYRAFAERHRLEPIADAGLGLARVHPRP